MPKIFMPHRRRHPRSTAGPSHSAEVDIKVQLLVRGPEKAAKVMAKYPQVQPVVGDFANLDLIESTCRSVDIVINAGPDTTHDGTLKAVLRVLQNRENSSVKSYFIHTSGAYLICDLREPRGTKSDKVWMISRTASKLVLSAALQVNLAILSPAGVTGIIPSVGHPYPITMPALFQCVRAFRSAFVIGEGENAVGMTHVRDFTHVHGLSNNNNKPAPPFPVWGKNAYYFGSAADTLYRRDWRTGLAPLLAKHGVLEGNAHEEVNSVTTAEVARRVLLGGDKYDPDAPPPPLDSWAVHIAHGLGANLRIRASKMRRLGWELEHVSLFEAMDGVIPAYVRCEKENAAR
ncbi:hypothetical protein PG993_013446 [Apiospora rasikravindrae]|uniref:NAD(P)-binding domain-containing protein n=1 Tax=Apiospora rasikravindrae TaxID=990691 RepID=A0ABR1RXN1_9PEZI